MRQRVSSVRAVGMVIVGLVTASVVLGGAAMASAQEIVLYASEAALARGHWAATASAGAAGSQSMKSADQGFSSANAPQTAPANYFEVSFDASAGTTYRVWLRLRAEGNSKWNDAVWVQFDDSTTSSGAAIYRIGTTSGLLVNLERCSGCGMSNWGWYNTAYWLNQDTSVRFATTGKHTMRVQTREDGVEIDQIVLSPVKYISSAPGGLTNDTTILAKTSTATTSPATSIGTVSPFKGTPFALPGTVNAVDFDNGGANVAYSDTTAGNSGSVYRTTDVDIQGATIGGYNIGWTTAGEWLNYSVNVASAGSYNVSLRVSAPSGNTVDVSIGGAAKSFAVPNTGGWQNWQTVTVPMSLAAGQQVMTVKFSTGGVNLHSINVAVASATTTPTIGTGTGGTFRVMTWNVHHGKNTSGQLSVPAQARFIASQNPHVVALQEVQTWDQNQPLMFQAELERLTGVKWYLQWAPVQPSQWTEGNVLLSRLPVTAQSYHQMHATSNWTVLLANRSVAHMTISVGGVSVHTFSTHLDYGNTSYRTAQLLDMMAWVEKFGAKRIVAGDFNATPGTYWINEMKADYYDTWEEVTGSASGGGTINGVRFDYQFRSKLGSDKVVPTRVFVADPAGLSDHKPVIADYSVRP